MISASLGNSATVTHNGNHRLLKKFDKQVDQMGKRQIFLNAGMQRKTFDAQAEALRLKLERLNDPPAGNILMVVCLPLGSLVKRMRGLRCGRHTGVCDCDLRKLDTKYPSEHLYALVGVNDGRERRVEPNDSFTQPATINRIVAPEKTLTAWAAMDMTALYPNILQQQGLILGLTTIGNASTALWIHNGQPVFGSTKGRGFRQHSKSGRWGIPSYQLLVTL